MSIIKDFILQQLEKVFPNYLKLGDECFLKKEYAKAIEFYKKGERVQGYNPYLHYNWAACLYALGKYEESIPRFKKAITIKHDFADAFCNWGLALINVGHPEQSIKQFKRAAKISPNDPKIYFNWGIALEKLNNIEEAVQLYQKVINLTPTTFVNGNETADRNHIMALNQLALYDLKKEDYKESAKKYQQLVKLDPNFAPGYYNLAIVFARLNKPDMAVKSLKKAVLNDPKAAQRIKDEPAFATLASLPEFKELLP